MKNHTSKHQTNEMANEQKLQQQLNQLSSELTPERDLWAGIERAINEPMIENNTNITKLAQFRAPLAWAASVIVAVLISVQFNNQLPPQKNNQITNFNAVSFIQTNFQQQKQSLLTSYGKPDIALLPTKMQQELQQLEKAQSSIVKALAKNSNNQNLLNLLQWTQQQELKLIERLYRPRWQSI